MAETCPHGNGVNEGCPECEIALRAASWPDNAAARITANPFYAINICPALAKEHLAVVDRDTWVEANEALIAEIGVRSWLVMLLDVLSGGYVRHKGVG